MWKGGPEEPFATRCCEVARCVAPGLLAREGWLLIPVGLTRTAALDRAAVFNGVLDRWCSGKHCHLIDDRPDHDSNLLVTVKFYVRIVTLSTIRLAITICSNEQSFHFRQAC